MQENNAQAASQDRKAAPAVPPAKESAAPAQERLSTPLSAGHVPMSEEFDRAKWTLPPLRIVAVGLAIFAVIAAAAIYLSRQKPAATGSIDQVTAVSLPQNRVLVAINVTFTSALADKTFYLRGVTARLTKPDGQELTDTPAFSGDFERYFQAFPELKQNALPPVMPETKLAPGQSTSGTIIVSFPVDKPTFEQRKKLAVVLAPYDHLPVTIEAKK